MEALKDSIFGCFESPSCMDILKARVRDVLKARMIGYSESPPCMDVMKARVPGCSEYLRNWKF